MTYTLTSTWCAALRTRPPPLKMEIGTTRLAVEMGWEWERKKVMGMGLNKNQMYCFHTSLYASMVCILAPKDGSIISDLR